MQLLNVNLSNLEVDNVFGILENNEKLSYLVKNKIFIHDINYTQDYKGVFNKKQVIKHLIDEHDFKDEGDSNLDNEPILILYRTTVCLLLEAHILEPSAISFIINSCNRWNLQARGQK